MHTSDLLLATQKAIPAEAETISHQLMLRAGMIRKLASGLYSWLPLGLRVLQNVTAIVREEMNLSGAQEILMPVVQPTDLWAESGRLEQYGPELLKFKDRHERAFCLGPTHEEVVVDLLRHELHSYRQLPVNVYQIQTKFRDEIRPRFGAMRAREFIMKDAYSFHLDDECLDKTYHIMLNTYRKIFTRVGVDFRAVVADNGSIGGSSSHEFHVLADAGEDEIGFSTVSDYAANTEVPALQGLKAGDPSPCGQGVLEIKRGIEVGHIFKLGDKYSTAMQASVVDAQGQARIMKMGCYGIGVSRVVAACIEQHHDAKGIIWPASIAPFMVVIIPMNYQKSADVKRIANALYDALSADGVAVLLDDRDERPGVKFADMDLIGIPVQVVVGDKSLAKGVVECRVRCTDVMTEVNPDALNKEWIQGLLVG